MFPIIFACILGRASHTLLVWRLERGEDIGVLDVLAGSSSLTSTVTSQLKLRLVSIYGLALIAIWILSPIGGQACLRQMTSSELIASEDASCTYMSPQGDLGHIQQGASIASQHAIIDGTFVASMLASAAVKASHIDAFGNVKIPKIEVCEQSSTPDQDGWYETSSGSTIFSSLVGLPLYWSPGFENADYATNVEAQYLNLDCPFVNTPMNMTAPHFYDHPNGSYVDGPWEGAGSEIWTAENMTERYHTSQNNAGALKPFTFSYWDYAMIRSSRCSLTTTYVEAEISCPMGSTCHVSKVRRSPRNATSTAYTLLENPDSTFYNLPTFLTAFVKLLTGHPATSGPMQNYLVQPDDPARGPGPEDQAPSNETFAIRLEQQFNGYWACMQGYTSITGGVNPDSGASLIAQSDGTYTTKERIIQAHHGWVVTLIVASTVMVIASLISPLVRLFMQKGPDLMLNISSLATRDSPYIAFPVKGTYMDASDRARLVKGVKVRFGDVQADADVGRLAVGTLDLPGAPRVAPIRRERSYM